MADHLFSGETALATPSAQVFSHTMEIASIELYPIRAQGGVSPKMALGSMPTRPALLVKLTDTDGCYGWGEVWANFPPRANIHKAHLIQDVVAPKLAGLRFTEPQEIQQSLRSSLSTYFLHIGQQHVFEHILAGLDIAAWDLALRNAGRSFAQHLGLAASSAATYASSINAADLDRLMPLHSAAGQTHFKLKIGLDDEADKAFLKRASDICPAGSDIMVDSNQSWHLDRAISVLIDLEEFELAFAEEPIRADAAVADWEKLASATTTPLAGGENIYGIESFLRMASAGMKVLQPDVAKWGGVSGSLQLASTLPEGTSLW
ncbi:MAG: enolase C-terminal domain-like protein, partial [Pseudomonadota bacterium]